jgi:hypothetical protein
MLRHLTKQVFVGRKEPGGNEILIDLTTGTVVEKLKPNR